MSDSKHGGFESLTPGRCCAGLGLVLFFIYPDVVLGQSTFIFRDFMSFGHPFAYYHKESFWRGELPLWNPLTCCGQPFLAQWLTMVLYPGSLLYLLLPLTWALPVFCLLHQILAGVGMYCLAWKWTRHRLGAAVAGVTFALNTLTQNSLMWPSHIAALGWMPWVIYLAEDAWRQGGRRLILAIFAGGVHMLAGAAEYILLTWLLIGGLAVAEGFNPAPDRRRRFRRMGLLVAGITLLAAAQLLPFLELLAHSQRSMRFGEGEWAIPLAGLGNLLVPEFHCFRGDAGFCYQKDQQWISSYYAGIGVLGLALTAAWVLKERRVRLLVLFLALGLILALGNAGQVYGFLKTVAPPIGFMRFPVKFVFWVTLTAPLLAAYGIRAALRNHNESGGRFLQRLLLIGLGLTVVVVLLAGYARFWPAEGEVWSRTVLSGTSRVAFLWLILGALAWLNRAALGRLPALACGLFVLLVAFDLLTASPMRLATARPEVYAPRLVELDPSPRHGGLRAMTSWWAFQMFNTNSVFRGIEGFRLQRKGLFGNANLLEDIPKVDGFVPLSLQDSDAIWSLLYFQTNDVRAATVLRETKRPYYPGLLDFLGVAHLSKPKVYHEWIPRTNALPLVTAGQQPRFGSDLEVLAGLLDTNFNPSQVVFLPEEIEIAIGPAEKSIVEIGDAHFAPQRIEFEVKAGQPALVVIAQNHYRPWRAYQDGEETPILRANLAFQAVAVPMGRHRIRLEYRDRWFECGVLLSLIATGLGVGCWRWRGRRSSPWSRFRQTSDPRSTRQPPHPVSDAGRDRGREPGCPPASPDSDGGFVAFPYKERAQAKLPGLESRRAP